MTTTEQNRGEKKQVKMNTNKKNIKKNKTKKKNEKNRAQ